MDQGRVIGFSPSKSGPLEHTNERSGYSTVATIYELNPMQAIEKQPPTPPKLTTEIGADGLNFPCIATPRRIHEESSTLEFIFM